MNSTTISIQYRFVRSLTDSVSLSVALCCVCSLSQGILASGSVLVSQSSPVYAYWDPLLQPWVHYVPYGRWFDDLPDVVRRLQSDDALAERIMRAGRDFHAQYTSREAAMEYTALLFDKYSQLLAEAVTGDDVGAVSCGSGLRAGPMGCDRGWKEYDGKDIQYPEGVGEEEKQTDKQR